MKKRILYTPQAQSFIRTLSIEAREKVIATFDKLGEQGYLRAPEAEKVEGQNGLFEVRVKDRAGQYRVFYFYHTEERIIALSGFTKKTQKTPPAEIRKALTIKKEIEQ